MSSILSKLINLAGNITGTLAVVNGGTGVTTSTGSVNNVLSTSPTLVTPILGDATATSVTFSPTTKGIVGTTAIDDAAASYVGEYKETSTGTSSVATSGAYFDAASITLTAGDWDVSGVILYSRNSATLTSTDYLVGISSYATTTANDLTQPANAQEFIGLAPTNFTLLVANIGPVRVQSNGSDLKVAGTTHTGVQVINLKGNIGVITVGTVQFKAFIRARRVR